MLAGGHQRRFGSLRLDEGAFVPAEAYIFRAPASYTRQDLIEMHTVGSPPVLAILLDDVGRIVTRDRSPSGRSGTALPSHVVCRRGCSIERVERRGT